MFLILNHICPNKKLDPGWAWENKKTERGISREEKPRQNEPREVVAAWDSMSASYSHVSPR